MAKEWNKCTKVITMKQFFPNVQDRLKMKIKVTPNFATMVTGHGKTRAYFNRFKIMEQATMEKKIDHLLYQCTLIPTPKEILWNKVLKIGDWPTSKKS